jgi:hypothetical protein
VAVLNRVLALLLGLALTAAGALLIAETVAAALGQRPLLVDRGQIDETLGQLGWDDALATGILIGALVLGGLLLLAQLLPRRPESLPLVSSEGRRAELEGRALASLLTSTVEEDVDVLRGRTRVGRRSARVDVLLYPDADPAAARDRLRKTVREAVEAVQLARNLRTRVRVSRSEELR